MRKIYFLAVMYDKNVIINQLIKIYHLVFVMKTSCDLPHIARADVLSECRNNSSCTVLAMEWSGTLVASVLAVSVRSSVGVSAATSWCWIWYGWIAYIFWWERSPVKMTIWNDNALSYIVSCPVYTNICIRAHLQFYLYSVWTNTCDPYSFTHWNHYLITLISTRNE